MNLENYEWLSLSLSNATVVSIVDKKSDKVLPAFNFPLTSDQYKIYVITKDRDILYIGATKSSIKNRLRSGLAANGKNGYHGYKWKDYDSVNLFVWCFESINKDQIECIEAELVFTIRLNTGNWPKKQNEIHFNNCLEEEGKLIANEIYKHLKAHLKYA